MIYVNQHPLRLLYWPIFAVSPSYGPMCRDVDGLVTAMKVLLSDETGLSSHDVLVPPLTFRDQVCMTQNSSVSSSCHFLFSFLSVHIPVSDL